jgi:hypothetical protein
MKVTLEKIKSKIKGETYLVLPDGRSTLCLITLENGYTVKGLSACVDPAEFDLELGRKYALADATNQIWPLEGYLLAQNMYEATCTWKSLPKIEPPPKKTHWTQTPEGKKIMANRKPRGGKK